MNAVKVDVPEDVEKVEKSLQEINPPGQMCRADRSNSSNSSKVSAIEPRTRVIHTNQKNGVRIHSVGREIKFCDDGNVVVCHSVVWPCLG